jgi:hypothetical protein
MRTTAQGTPFVRSQYAVITNGVHWAHVGRNKLPTILIGTLKQTLEVSMGDKVLGFLREARAALADEQATIGKSREASIQITHIETAILWRQEEIRLKAPVVNECARS